MTPVCLTPKLFGDTSFKKSIFYFIFLLKMYSSIQGRAGELGVLQTHKPDCVPGILGLLDADYLSQVCSLNQEVESFEGFVS